MARQNPQYTDKWRSPLGIAPELRDYVSIKIKTETADEPADAAEIDVFASEEEFGSDIVLGVTVPGHYSALAFAPEEARDLWEALGVAMRYLNVRGVSFAPAPEGGRQP